MIVCEAPRRRGCILLCDAWLDETGVLHSIMMVHGQCLTRAWDLATRELRGETGRESSSSGVRRDESDSSEHRGASRNGGTERECDVRAVCAHCGEWRTGACEYRELRPFFSGGAG